VIHGRSNARHWIDEEKLRPAPLGTYSRTLTESSLKLSRQIIDSAQKDQDLFIFGHQGDGIQRQHDACLEIRFQRHPPPLFESKRVPRSELSYRSAGFLWIMRNRFV